jgi:hypothetical protein
VGKNGYITMLDEDGNATNPASATTNNNINGSSSAATRARPTTAALARPGALPEIKQKPGKGKAAGTSAMPGTGGLPPVGRTVAWEGETTLSVACQTLFSPSMSHADTTTALRMSNNVAEGHAERLPFTPLHGTAPGVDPSDMAASGALLGKYTDARQTLLARAQSTRSRDTSPAEPRHAFAGVAEATVVSGALLRITDGLVRRVLPWNAVCCPRAVESLRDLRIKVTHAPLSACASVETMFLTPPPTRSSVCGAVRLCWEGTTPS